MLHKEAGGDGLCAIERDVNEPTKHCVYHSNNEYDVPEGHIGHSDIGEDESEKSGKSNCKHSDDEPKVLYRIVVSHKLVIGVTNLSALPCRVAIGDAGEIDIGVDIGSDEVEDIVKAEKVGLTNLSSAVAGSALVTNEQLHDQSWNLKESIEERSSNDTSPIFSHQSSGGSVPVG